MGKLDEKKKIKREALLKAAYELYTSAGINVTSVSQIAAKAGLAKGTFYLYYKDKYEIQRELITRKASELFEKIKNDVDKKKGEGAQGSIEDVVNSLVDFIIDEFDNDKSMLEFIAKNLNWGLFQSVVLEGEGEFSNSFLEWYDKLVEESGRKFRNIKLMMYMIVELINSSCYNVILYSEPVGVEELRTELKRVIPAIIQSQEIK